MPVEFVEALAEILVIVERQVARVRIQREGAQRSGQPRELQKQFFGMPALGDQQVPQRRQRRIDGVQQPEVGDLARGELGRPVRAAAAGLRLMLALLSSRISISRCTISISRVLALICRTGGTKFGS